MFNIIMLAVAVYIILLFIAGILFSMLGSSRDLNSRLYKALETECVTLHGASGFIWVQCNLCKAETKHIPMENKFDDVQDRLVYESHLIATPKHEDTCVLATND